jgi:hypothetical protein
MLHFDNGWLVPDIKEYIALIFKGQAVQED